MLEPGDYGHLTFPIINEPDSPGTLDAKLVISSAPIWLRTDADSSILRTEDIPSGSTVTLRFTFIIGPELTRDNADAEFQIVIDYGDARDRGFFYGYKTWHITTENGMKSFRLKCVTDHGWSCGNYISDDNTPPVTELVSSHPKFIDDQGRLFLPKNHGFITSLYDPQIPNQEFSRTADVFVAIDRTVSKISEMEHHSLDRFSLSPGSHVVTLSSRDAAGNEEKLHSTIIIVDEIPPSAPLNLRSEHTPKWEQGSFTVFHHLTWENPEDTSGIGRTWVRLGDAPPFSIKSTSFLVDMNAFPMKKRIQATIWLEDNVGNVNPDSAVSVELKRYEVPSRKKD